MGQLRYPALGAIAPLSADPVEWGPAVVLLLRIAHVLRRVLLLVSLLGIVLGRYLRLVFLLEERVEVVLVLLGGGGQMLVRALLPVLAALQTLGLVQLLLSKPGIAFADRLVSS